MRESRKREIKEMRSRRKKEYIQVRKEKDR